jgi:hypothetical protein
MREELLEATFSHRSLITCGKPEFAYDLMEQSFRMPGVPNGNNFACIGPVYAPSVVRHRGGHAPMR